MMKRLLSVFIAVVIFTTAVVVLPNNNIVQGESTNTSTGNNTWDGSVHAVEDGQFPSKNMYTLTQDQDEYKLPNIWHANAFNECELDVDVEHGEKVFYKETGVGGDLITVGRGNTPDQFKNNIPGNDGGSYSYYAALYDNYENAQDPKNIRLAVYNYNGFDVTEYQYLRFQMMRQNIELDPNHWGQGDDPYAFVMIYGANGEKIERRFTEIFNNPANRIYNYLFDVSDVNFVVTCLEFHFKTIRRESTGKADPARVWVDNIRFVKNATHTKYYASKVNTKVTKFHGCDSNTNFQAHIPLNSTGIVQNYNYSFGSTDDSTSVVEGSGSFALQPEDFNQNCWYQIALQNNTGVKLSDYQYFRFYLHVGDAITQANLGEVWPTKEDFRVYFNEHYDYLANNGDANAKNMAYVANPDLTMLKQGVKAAGWYLCTVPINKLSPYDSSASSFDLNKVIKSISIQFGSLNFPNPTSIGVNGSALSFHIDELEFIGYSYEEDTDYKYQAGHYQVIENFEDKADAKLNVRSGADASDYLAIRNEALVYNPAFKAPNGGWTYKYKYDKTNSQLGHYYSSENEYIVSQGLYADWIRANAGTYANIHSGNLEAAYNLDNRPFNLGKFTHFSLDLTIRPQHQTLNSISAPGLTGTKETFYIRIRSNSNYNDVCTLKFTLNLSGDTTGKGSLPFYSSDDGIEILPLEGFIPGRDGVFTCCGTMRITFTLADILANATDTFDITKIDQFRFIMLRSNTGAGAARNSSEYDNRNIDLFLDNFVGFTPDMTVTVKTEGVPESEYNQPFVYTIIGGDDVTTHVNATFTLQGNDSEVIYNLPFNSYTIYQSDWSWRFNEENKQVAQKMATLDKPAGGKFTYKDMVENKIALAYTVVFRPKKSKVKWLSDVRRVHFKAKN